MIHGPHTYGGKEYDMISCKLFWKEKGWVAPYAGDLLLEEELDRCGYYCGHRLHLGGNSSYCTLPVWHANPFDMESTIRGAHSFMCKHPEPLNMIDYVFVIDTTRTMECAITESQHTMMELI